ncbi:MAG: phage baseplate assembly protein V [Hyphomicrobiaceae bacterium]|nr:phage baseplate assembly protein V [Hyphomicrobiaceae bacterium]
MGEGIESLRNMMRLEGGRNAQQIGRSRVGKVTSYDPENYSVKVKLEPEGNESGWIPLSAESVGSGFGSYSAPRIGDQVEVTYQEGDSESGRVTSRIPSKKNFKPPRVEEGETLYKHKDGATIKLDKDGNLITSQGGTTSKIDKNGHVSIDAPGKNVSVKASTFSVEATTIALKGKVTLEGNFDQVGVHKDSIGGHV